MGLPSNPFSPSHWTPETVRYILGAEERAGLLRDLESARWHGALVGPHGAGKSTLLMELVREAQARGKRVVRVRARLDRGSVVRAAYRIIRCRRGMVVALDGGECLPGWLLQGLWRWSAWRGVGIVMTLHSLPGAWFRGVIRPMVCEAEVLQDVLRREIGERGELSVAEIEEALKRNGGNARLVIEELYWRAERAGANPIDRSDRTD